MMLYPLPSDLNISSSDLMTRIPIVYVPTTAAQKALFYRLYAMGYAFGLKAASVDEKWDRWLMCRSGSGEMSVSPYMYITVGKGIDAAEFAPSTVAKMGSSFSPMWHKWLRLNSPDQLIRYLAAHP